MDSRWLKNKFRHTLLQKANFKRIHIVGCSRSGTTLLYFALSAFRDTILYNREVSVWNWPTMLNTLELIAKKGFSRKDSFIITKRNANWWKKEKLNQLIKFVENFNIGIIYLVRDPRDVLLSKHPLSEKKYFVDFDLWKNSIDAGEYLQKELANYPKLLVIRYEDLILNISQVEQALKTTFGLKLKEGVRSLSNLQEYVDTEMRDSKMIKYMHKLRNFDPSSINKWKHDAEKRQYLATIWQDKEKRQRLDAFMEKYNYSPFPFEEKEMNYEQ